MNVFSAVGHERSSLQHVLPGISLLVTILVLACPLGTLAQAPVPPYPAKPVRLIVGFTPGSGADITARVIGHKLGEAYGQ